MKNTGGGGGGQEKKGQIKTKKKNKIQIEKKKMKKSNEAANKNGAHGVVFGVLNKHKIDFKKNEELINIAKDLNIKCTFPKAFDQ